MSYNKTKTDPILGQKVHEHLLKCGVETPTFRHAVERKDKIKEIESSFRHIMLVLGLSKINRVVEYFSKRPQIQERLTEQIYHALQFILETDDIAVVIDAQHYCVKSRGI